MDLKQLRYFYTIAKEGQITKAAKVLHMAQPPLSQSLKLLEEELDVVLFERNGRKMELTKAGNVLYTRLQSIFEQLEDTILEVQDTKKGVKGKLSIGCAKTCFSYLPERLKKFQKMYPNVTFELREGDTYMLSEQLKKKEIDIAFVRLPLQLESFSSIPLPDERYVAVLPRSWQHWREKEHISLEELAQLPLMLLHRIQGIGQFEVILEAFHKRGYQPKIICECPDVDMLLGLVSEGLGVSIVPESTFLKPFSGNVTVLPITDETIVSKACVIWLKDRYLPQQAKNFLDLI
ncbi:LysR family transcriptional regulator [Fervidibacillus halotolerans]|uniref:LysR family transcriptional regulator n=1 Tax=Fervidibacillus halotolerans TaxID=2980027 RepID=A0A9E8M0V1_9BACI|nr:LysR family transcriptional regulator [Fervidibacillus halotolerans]WAA13418.1 LysR family transcriptional regulator [Fervidibacillus halotolerans]